MKISTGVKMAFAALAGAAVTAAVLLPKSLSRDQAPNAPRDTRGPDFIPGPDPAVSSPLQRSIEPRAATAREPKKRQPTEALEARIAVLEQENKALLQKTTAAVPSSVPPASSPGTTDPSPKGKFHDFTQAELAQMAQNCELRIDLPPLEREPYEVPAHLGARLHLDDPQQSQVAAALNQVRVDALARLRALYVEATGDAAGADSLEPMTLAHEILQKAPRAQTEAARTKLARERAGLLPPGTPDAGTVVERYLRFMGTVGDSFQRTLEPSLGAQQAARVRDALVVSMMNMSGCTVQR